jgi:type II restriction enzyme
VPSPVCERTIADATGTGNALLKFISANDVGQTGGHQCGYYLPISVWQMFSPYPPDRGTNYEHFVTIVWQDGRETRSCVKWYGVRTRREYRLTQFGRGFPWLKHDKVGSLLVLVIRSLTKFAGYVLDSEEDIEEITAALGVEITGRWGVYRGGAPVVEDEDQCIERLFGAFAEEMTGFPTGEMFSSKAREVLDACVRGFGAFPPDESLLRCLHSEYHLFRKVELNLCRDETRGPFDSVDAFLKVASAIMNRRKSRAGRSLENHVEFLLRKAEVPHEMRPDIPGRPDIVIPGKVQYDDLSFPVTRLCIVGVKTTCKDRWRQILQEAPRIKKKHILTIQSSISTPQLKEMKEAGITLVVPEKLQRDYPRDSGLTILNVETFIRETKTKLT